MVETRTNCRRHSGWVYLVAAVAWFVLLCCDAELLLMPYSSSRKPVIPSILPPLFNWLGLTTGSTFGRQVGWCLLLWVPLATGLVGFLVLVLAYKNSWGPLWLAWSAVVIPTALLGSELMAFAASLPFFSSLLPAAVGPGLAASGLLALGSRRGWRHLWLWWLIAWIGGFYAFFVILARVLMHFGIVQTLL
jgi:hypothetical protein